MSLTLLTTVAFIHVKSTHSSVIVLAVGGKVEKKSTQQEVSLAMTTVFVPPSTVHM